MITIKVNNKALKQGIGTKNLYKQGIVYTINYSIRKTVFIIAVKEVYLDILY